ncbi:MAG: hypothetical protein ACTSXY_12290 [Promethearchaeota archaeon]
MIRKYPNYNHKLLRSHSQQIKKDDDYLSGSYLETRSKNRGRQLRESMPVNADRQLQESMPVNADNQSADIQEIYYRELTPFEENQLRINHPQIYKFLRRYG